jgi:hypothetical protein
VTNPGDEAPAGADYIVRRLDDLQKQITQLGPSVVQSFNTTVATLNATNAYLSSLVTLTATDTITSWTTSDAGWVDTGASITLTVTRTSLVSFLYTAAGQFNVSGTGGQVGYYPGYAVDGTSFGLTYPTSGIIVSGSGVTGYESDTPIILSKVITLAAGTHTIKAQMQRFAVGGGSKTGQRANGLLVVSVIG